MASASVAPPAVDNSTRPPTPDERMFYGLPGDFVRLIAPHSEADRVALLLQWLGAFGSIVGRHAYTRAEADEHHGNLFIAIVGASGNQGRKGTSFGRVREFMRHVDLSWRIRSGLVSGEGLIENVRDADATTGDPGVDDKRLFVGEMEFARMLQVMQRQGNTLSMIVRNAFDQSCLESLARHAPLRATGAHVSITAHITPDELTRYLTATEAGDGFGNRFLWVYAQPSQRLPYGGSVDDRQRDALVQRTKDAVALAQTRERLAHAPATVPHWTRAYLTTLTRERAGLAGALTSRADALALRLALIYALADSVQIATGVSGVGTASITRERIAAAAAPTRHSLSALSGAGDVLRADSAARARRAKEPERRRAESDRPDVRRRRRLTN